MLFLTCSVLSHTRSATEAHKVSAHRHMHLTQVSSQGLDSEICKNVLGQLATNM